MKHKKHKKVVYPNQNLICELCDPPRSFKNYQGLRGHRRMIHKILDPIVAKSAPEVEPGAKNKPVAKSSDTIETLKEENELLRLQAKNRQLVAQFPSTSREPADLMLQLGLGSFDPGVKAEVQRRAVALSTQSQAPSWIDKILDRPESFKLIAGALKGALGVDHGGDNAASGLGVLRELGIDLKSLWERGQAPKSGSLEIAGMNLQGATLTPELLVALLDYKGKIETAEKDYAGKKEMSDQLGNLIKVIVPEFISRFKSGSRESISREIMPEAATFVCDKCGAENELPADMVPGMEIHCVGKDCSMSWITDTPMAKQKPARQKREIAIQEPEIPLCSCPGCGQKIELTGRSIGESIKCPVCQVEYVVQSGDVAVAAEDPLTESEKQTQQFLHR